MIHHLYRLQKTFPSINPHRSYIHTARWRPLRPLEGGTLQTFREKAFVPSELALLQGHYNALPSIQKWFRTAPDDDKGAVSLNYSYLSRFGDAIVPLEYTRLPDSSTAIPAEKEEEEDSSFQRAEAPFYVFLEWTKSATPTTPSRLYLAQASFASLPPALQADLPTPELVAEAGNGDVYDANVWMGIPPTYTPLHRDPNPNLFVQLAGEKVVRLLPPEMGDGIFGQVQETLGRSKSPGAFRGEEMMKGAEKRLLEERVWNGASVMGEAGEEVGYEVHVGRGDGLFIPKGWWHSVKGVGDGITASVNWWFR